MFERNFSRLSRFEFYISIQMKKLPDFKLKQVVKSYEYFVKNYSNWHLNIDRWKVNTPFEGEIVILRTMNHHKFIEADKIGCPMIQLGAFETASTKHIDHHSSFYPDAKDFQIYLTNEKRNITWPSCLFKNVDYFLIEMPVEQTWMKNLYNIVRFAQNMNDFIDIQSSIIDISHFIHLSKLTEIEFGSTIIKRFPSIEEIELQVYSFDNCVFMINEFLTQLKCVSHIKVYYERNTLLDDPFSREYIFMKRYETFPNLMIDSKKIEVKNDVFEDLAGIVSVDVGVGLRDVDGAIGLGEVDDEVWYDALSDQSSSSTSSTLFLYGFFAITIVVVLFRIDLSR
ncbi:hypothetical protein I4U23_006141 [Adineta vaga]|nr:hypothetical protein I4U23_006141 [Adineta vaga]